MNTSDRESAPEFPGFPGDRSGSLLDPELLDACRRIAARFAAPHLAEVAPVPPSSIRVPTVTAASAHVVAGMSGYGS
jgi:hypothetical protein